MPARMVAGGQVASVLQATPSRRQAPKAIDIGTAETRKPEKPRPEGTPAEKAAIVLQKKFRAFRWRGTKLHRQHLAERLQFEWNVCLGAFRLFCQILTFGLLIVAVQKSPTNTMRSLYHSIESAFDFEALKQLPDRDAFFNEGLRSISANSKDFFALSSKYFEAEGGGVEILREAERLTEPKIIGGLALPIQLPDFSFSVWVRTEPQFASGYLVRKRLVPAGAGSELACVGWHLDALSGPALHYGAADYFPTGGGEGPGQEQVRLAGRAAFTAEEFRLLTVVVTTEGGAQSVTFFEDLRELGRAALPRPITDCFNNLEGFLVGDSGMTLAQLRFYPRRLSLSLITEVHASGTVLGDVATGSQPPTHRTPDLQELARDIDTTLAGVSSLVGEQQPRAEIDTVLQTVHQERHEGAEMRRSPPAPVGKLPVTEKVDDVTGRSYYELLAGPVTMTEPAGGEERYFDPDQFPSWAGAGMSLSLWVRRSAACDAACGSYVISAHGEGPDSSARCYSAWIETRGVYFDNSDSGVGFHYKLDILDPRYHLTPNHWRHIVFAWDQDTDMWHYYQDGVLAYSVPWGSSVREADCPSPSTRVTVGARFPGWTYGVEDEYFDLRMWVGPALSASHVRSLALAETPPLTALHFQRAEGESEREFGVRAGAGRHLLRCTPDSDDAMQDRAWTDLYGHSCEWYFRHVTAHPGVCQLQDALVNCPIACKSRQPCLSADDDFSVYFAWDSIRRIEPRGPNGTLCLRSGLDRAQLLEECRRWQEREGWAAEAGAWEQDMAERGDGAVVRGRRVNLTACEEAAAAVDSHCGFDAEAVRNFTRELRANGGDYTVGFWMKALGEPSLHEDGGFYPSLTFHASLSPPLAPLAFAKFGTGTHGEARVRTSCPPGGSAEGIARSVENVELQQASRDEWTFIAFARTNGTMSRGHTATNLGGVREEAGAWSQCLFDDDIFFTAVEVNYPVLLSPLLLVPRALPLAKLQERYYREVGGMRARSGPLVTNAERNQTGIPVTKRDLGPRSVLMAPPLLFSTRVLPSAHCPFRYSRALLASQHAQVLGSKCAAPFQCSAEVRSRPEETIACAGPPQQEQEFFGLLPRVFNGKVGFADLLYSITDSTMVFRGGELRETSGFVDAHTEHVIVLLVFFTPQYGITSVLEVSADVSGPSPTVATSLQHYTIFEGAQLTAYIALLSAVVVVSTIMAVDLLLEWRSERRHSSEDDENKGKVGRYLTDLLNIVMMIIFVALQLPTQLQSAGETERVVGSLAGIEWESSVLSLEDKKDVFFDGVLSLLKTIQWNSNLDAFLNVILLISLLRIIQCTSLHPRLALLTGTLRRAADDLWHTAILIIAIMVSFAGIATWRFGSQYDDFGSFEVTMQTEFKLMFGEFLRYWGESREMQAFVVLYYMVMFLLILNFLLAIIVESYMKVRRYNEEIEYETEFFTDLFFSVASLCYGKLHRWPSQPKLARAVSRLCGKLALGYDDLWRLGLFRRQRDVGAFLSFYSRLECLQPPDIGPAGDGLGAESRKIVREVGELLGVRPPTLKEVACHAELRRSSRQLSSHSPGPAAVVSPRLEPPVSLRPPPLSAFSASWHGVLAPPPQLAALGGSSGRLGEGSGSMGAAGGGLGAVAEVLAETQRQLQQLAVRGGGGAGAEAEVEGIVEALSRRLQALRRSPVGHTEETPAPAPAPAPAPLPAPPQLEDVKLHVPRRRNGGWREEARGGVREEKEGLAEVGGGNGHYDSGEESGDGGLIVSLGRVSDEEATAGVRTDMSRRRTRKGARSGRR